MAAPKLSFRVSPERYATIIKLAEIERKTVKAGALPEDTKVARMASKALKQLGLQPQSYRYEWNPQLQQLNIVIETGR